ncbi:putative ankyrin repeat-containing domain, PGG domain, ankyrin repeat-containing domain superfamily [Helianthus annuus]|nr:putative ankyrin repeat-containing domain, PGG domain, ankyrin repeat-containing domain superfamily [Helianthus annuus]KAJ0711572.1 putative ankyrin repeat-containing domain, PGG domain, ankyrin repeat-containing domain superfamily [Helianthus annuus]KAJ0888350.1 putative ankyrin repeat-containing domain, PGG domain, ankyrin repeat-containing domain superfamily [Helianthus annuus]
MKQPGVQLASIDEQKPVSKPQKDEIIVPVTSLALPRPNQPNLPIQDLLNGSREEYIKLGVPLYEASIKGDWKAAKAIINEKPDLVRYSITENSETALHIAASAKKTKRMQDFVKNLVDMMEVRDLELQNNSSNTALCLAAAAGNVEMVKILVEKNRALLVIPGSQQMMPLYMAALFGQNATVEYLYNESKGLRDDGWNPQNRGWLLQKCVEAELFHIALKIVEDRQELASNGSLLGVLAKKPDVFYGTTSNMFQKFISWAFERGSNSGSSKKANDAMQLLRIIWKNIASKPKKEIDDIIRGPPDAVKKDDRLPYDKEDQTLHLLKLISENIAKMPVEIQKLTAGTSAKVTRAPTMGNARKTYSSRILFVAAEMGNTVFIVELIRLYPDLIWKVNDNNQSIFHIAVKHRHEGIYNLLYEIGSMKDLITPLRDENDNNMLHLVGTRANRNRLEDVSGVAFQMQRELLWFKEVEAMIPPSYRERKNKDGLTPHELFTREHKDLVVQGEKWMKGTASHCMVVAALIATIVFAVAFMVPGGYSQGRQNQSDGIPIFHSQAIFMVFLVADAISLFSSTASILLFLSILTSRYAERDFLQSLPKKLMLGLATLFLSMTTMTIAFSVSFYLLYKNGLIWMPIMISMFAMMPILLFTWLQYRLLADVGRSTYASTYLFKPKKLMLYYENPKPSIMRSISSLWSSK